MFSKNNNPQNYYRSDIDGLRAVSILIVLIFHAFPAFANGGFVGVDVFFVISGYLIYGIIARDLRAGKFSFYDFYFRRVRRIFPTLAIILFLCFIFGAVFLYPQEYKELALQAISGASFVINFKLLGDSGYFDDSSENKPLLHLWSLSIEEQFYILCPLLLWFCYKKRYNLLAVLIAITSLSFLSNVLLVYKNQAAAFYLSPCRFFEIGLGAILCELQNSQLLKSPEKKLSNFYSALGFLIIIFCFFFVNKHQAFPGYIALLPCLAAILIIYAGQNSDLNNKILSNRFVVYIGLISYPLYLWHWPIISFITIYKGQSLRIEAGIAAIAASMALASLTYHFVEKKARQIFYSKSHLAVLVFILLAQALIGYAIFKNNGFENSKKSNENLIIRSSNRPNISDENCFRKYGKELGNNYCRIAGNSDKKIFIIGDSHSQEIFSGYSEELVNLGYQTIHLAYSGCPFAVDEKDVEKYKAEDRAEIKKCNIIFDKILDLIISEKPRAILYSNDGFGYRNVSFSAATEKTISKIPDDISVIYFMPAPHMPFKAFTCIRDSKLLNNHCPFTAENSDDYKKIISEIAKKHKNMQVINLESAFCKDNICFAMNSANDGLFYYRDGVHLSEYGSKYMAKKFPLNNLPSRHPGFMPGSVDH